MDTLSWFPPTYPDEDFRSIVWRYRRWMGATMTTVMKQLFDVVAHEIPLLPHNLNHLVSQLPIGSQHSFHSFIANHTLFPLYQPFISNTHASKALHSMQYRTVAPIIKLRQITHNETMYCPICLVSDSKKYGEAYNHRIHQVRGIHICPEHRVELISRCRSCGELLEDKHFQISGVRCRCGCRVADDIPQVDMSSRLNRVRLRLAMDAQHLLRNPAVINERFLQLQYFRFAYSAGYISHDLCVDNNRYRDALTEWLTIPELLACGLRKADISRPVSKTMKGDNPVVHLIFVQFFAGSLAGFVGKTFPDIATPLPFPSGPWPCRNRVCAHFMMPVIHKCRRGINTHRELNGTFECPMCGYTYSVVWGGGKTSFLNSKFMVKKFGPVWENELLRIYSQTRNFAECARRLGADKTTVKMKLERLKYSSNNFNSKSTTEINENKNIVEIFIAENELSTAIAQVAASEDKVITRLISARSQIQTVCLTNPGASRMQIKLLTRVNYVWLMKYDKEWMESALPPRKAPGVRRNQWEELDQKNSKEILNVAEFAHEKFPKSRLTRKRILQLLNHGSSSSQIRCHPEKLPLTMKAIEDSVESIDDYCIRWLPHAISAATKRFGKVDFDRLTYYSCYRKCSPLTKERVINELTKLGYV